MDSSNGPSGQRMSSGQSVTDLPVDPVAILSVIREAGNLAVSMQDRNLRVRSKSTAADLVTEADIACEKLIAQRLEQIDPAIGFWGEESNTPPEEEYFWLVDPIDGTVNYAMGIPWYAVNIALNHGEEVLIGVTLALPSGELFWAAKDQGAFRVRGDGIQERLQVSATPSLDEAILSTGFPYDWGDHPDNNQTEFNQLYGRYHGVRRMGSAAIDLAYVAAGIFSAHWEGFLSPWDVAPGSLLIHEAGGLVTTYSGKPRQHRSRSLVASNGQPGLHQALIDQIQQARAGLGKQKLRSEE